jgi:hypothetical protein
MLEKNPASIPGNPSCAFMASISRRTRATSPRPRAGIPVNPARFAFTVGKAAKRGVILPRRGLGKADVKPGLVVEGAHGAGGRDLGVEAGQAVARRPFEGIGADLFGGGRRLRSTDRGAARSRSAASRSAAKTVQSRSDASGCPTVRSARVLDAGQTNPAAPSVIVDTMKSRRSILGADPTTRRRISGSRHVATGLAGDGCPLRRMSPRMVPPSGKSEHPA